MQSTGARVTIAVAAIAVVVIGFIALSGGDDSDDSTTATTATTSTTSADTTGGGDTTEKKPQKPESQVPVIEVKNGEPVGGVKITFATSDGKLLEVSRRGRISARSGFLGHALAADL